MTAATRVGLVEDHRLVALGVIELLRQDGFEVDSAATVPDLLAMGDGYVLVVLDLRLGDGSTVTENIEGLRRAGYPVLVLTSGESADLVREAARCDVLGIVRKSRPEAEVRAALVDAVRGRAVTSIDWAAAIDADPQLADAALSPREREVLALYAAGEKAQSVASSMGISTATVANYISRIRSKYAAVGRPAPTKVDLYRRAAEDRLLRGAR
ncbi:response regulator transcription factor [Microbacterium sp. LRZ72]|uniref:response regulator transcription factor n=1 Tax=Microbacterium sp. LRZ72 TaxID=2942481 RepID=UPI0029AB5EEC|nr:response regulator transcription factor [Microbacterium sp. LRZ72]MDX2377336.1 response regulator transcription factor [Microbacterium sp. LRZ72]